MAGIKEEKKIYLVGIYCRLSKDDGTDNESASIATQKSILTDYVKKQGWHLAKTYVDDGYSGTNFQRPSFQNMIKDIESGLINCVITKDLSRLGRNYLDCGLYLEVFFPEHNVRYIAVNDGVDTLNKSAMDITPFRNILNEMYSADVSVKIKSAYRARFQQGKFMGTTAPYGYVKDPADHNHLLIDDKVAHVVREIFDLALAGNGIAKIRKHINKQHILRPAAYAAEQGATGYERYFEENEENRYIWSENSVRGILRSPIYAGNLAGYKRIAANMKSKKRPSKLPEEWEVIPDTHEGIVTQEEFDTVQQLITSRRLPENKGGFENIFAGVIKCADCGYAMRAMSANRRKRPDIIDCVQYSCNNYGRYGNIMCTAHSIEARDLFNAVLTDINRFADMAVNDEKAVRAIEKRLTETDQSKAKALEKEQRKLNKRLAELDRLFSSLYEDKVMERITERNFEMMSGKYQKEQLEIEARLKEVTETLSDSYEKTQGVRDFLSLIRNYQGIKELDATIINALIDKILVSEREKLTDGMVRQEIKIYYKFIGFVGELHITPTKRWTALKPKNCTVCGVEYVPRSGISKYCPACAKKIQREKSNESKRRSRERNRQACIELSAKNDRLKWIFSMKDVLRTRREMFGLTQEQLCEGICSVKSLRRAEKGQTDMQREILKKLLNRLGLSGQMQWSRLITSDREVIRMAEELADYINDRKFSVASKQLESLKSRIDLDIPQNKQYFLEKQALLEFEQGKVTREEFVKMEKEALECTLRAENLYRKENVYLTEREIICISNSWKGMEGKEKRESINLILRLYDNYALNNGLSQAISVYEIVTEAAVNELGNNGEHVRAEEIDRKSIKASLSCRRVWDIHYKIYDILWNEKKLMKKSGKRVSNNRMNTELKRCIIMSHYVKRYFYENVYKEKLS